MVTMFLNNHSKSSCVKKQLDQQACKKNMNMLVTNVLFWNNLFYSVYTKTLTLTTAKEDQVTKLE